MHIANTTWNAVAFLALVALPSVEAQAQTVTYHFTGTRVSGSPELGDSVAGTIVLVPSAVPTVDFPILGGQIKFWYDGGFSVDLATEAGFVGGTETWGGSPEEFRYTFFWDGDEPEIPVNETGIVSQFFDGDYLAGIAVYSGSSTVGDALASMPNPWDPFAAEYQVVEIGFYRFSTGEEFTSFFQLDTFVASPPNIIIDGCDTGIEDFTYQGQLVSALLAECAVGVENHGQYASCVAHLTNELKQAGLLTGEQKGVIQSCAAQSSIGK